MSFNVALSGLRAANQDLATTGNNIANASTVGFKQSRAEFADVYANSVLGSGGRSPGSGAVVADIAQQFGQGNISITNNSLDLAISGQGFFVLKDQAGSVMYSRSGIFGLDKEGYVVANNGAKLQGFGADINGRIVEGAPGPLQIATTDAEPKATGEVTLRLNLDSRVNVPAEAVGTPPTSIPKSFDPIDGNSYNWSTAATVYDSLGNSHVLTTYYQKSMDPPAVGSPAEGGTSWNIYTRLGNDFFNAAGDPIATINDEGRVVQKNPDGSVGGPFTFPAPNDAAGFPGIASSIDFDAKGFLSSDVAAMPRIAVSDIPGADELEFTIDLAGSTQHGDAFSVKDLHSDGYAPGRLTGVNIDDTGVVFARYTNGESRELGKIALANFDNPQGLIPVGGTNWVESFDSGQPVIGSPQTGALGAIQSGALEDSNVDLSMELVNLIIAQRNYQANAKTIETANAVTQSIINLR